MILPQPVNPRVFWMYGVARRDGPLHLKILDGNLKLRTSISTVCI